MFTGTPRFREPSPPPRMRRVTSWWGYLMFRFFVCAACAVSAAARVLYELTDLITWVLVHFSTFVADLANVHVEFYDVRSPIAIAPGVEDSNSASERLRKFKEAVVNDKWRKRSCPKRPSSLPVALTPDPPELPQAGTPTAAPTLTISPPTSRSILVTRTTEQSTKAATDIDLTFTTPPTADPFHTPPRLAPIEVPSQATVRARSPGSPGSLERRRSPRFRDR